MLILAATPIGNLGDATARLKDALTSVPVIAAEDTRMTQHLIRALGLTTKARLVSLHDHNERDRATEIAELAREDDVLVITDAGMPTVSDPGFVLVREAAALGVPVTVLPGPSAVLVALALSGLPTDRFCFEGFLPKKAGERASALAALAAEQRTMVFFESPHRIAESLTELATAFGADRPAAVARELTKLHEEVVRGPLSELAQHFAQGARGEFCIVVGGAAPVAADEDAALDRVLTLVQGGASLKDAAASVAAETGLAKNVLYDAALKARKAVTR